MSNNIRIICFYGGPCTGKSSIASRIFADLKKIGANVELITEKVKEWTFCNSKPASWDQIYLQGVQISKLFYALNSGIQYVIEENPPFLNAFYAQEYGLPCYKYLFDIAKEFDSSFPSKNIHLTRHTQNHDNKGIYQTLKEAKEIDNKILSMLDQYKIRYNSCYAYDIVNLYRYLSKFFQKQENI